MTKKITISVDEETKNSLSALARKRKSSVSGLISELIARESRKENISVGKSLGTLLRSHKNVLGEDEGKEYEEIFDKIMEEKYHTR